MSLLGFERDGSSSDGISHTASTFPGRPQSTISGRVPAPRWASPWWLLFLALAVSEIVALGVREHRVPSESDWVGATDHVRRELKPKDAVSVAPGWADPLLRLYLGDKIDLKMAGRADLEGYERLWVLSIRGARDPAAPRREPDAQQVFGRVRVERYDFGRSSVLVDLAEALPSARVEIRRDGGIDESCLYRTFPPAVARAGLGGGVLPPRQRFQCDFERPWLWVGTTVVEVLDLSPHFCVWTHPQGREPISVTYPNVTLGNRLVLYAGLDYHDERDGTKAPVELRVLVNGRELERFVHRDGDGRARYELDLAKKLGKELPVRGDLRLEVSTADAFRRSFCWTGTLQEGVRRSL